MAEIESNLVIPVIQTDLMDYLLTIFPDRSPDITWSDREVWKRHGEISAVKHLLSLYRAQHGQTDVKEPSNNVLRRR